MLLWVIMCEQCEWGNPVVDMLKELIEKYTDWVEHTDDFTEQTVLEEILDDLKALVRGR